jgi:hyperosmotically inducible protein
MCQLKIAYLAFVSTIVLSTSTFAQSEYAPSTNTVSAEGQNQPRRMNWRTGNDVRKAMTSTDGLDATDIRIIASGTNISLDGTVPYVDQIQLAQSAARSVAGDKAIGNNLTVRIGRR